MNKVLEKTITCNMQGKHFNKQLVLLTLVSVVSARVGSNIDSLLCSTFQYQCLYGPAPSWRTSVNTGEAHRLDSR